MTVPIEVSTADHAVLQALASSRRRTIPDTIHQLILLDRITTVLLDNPGATTPSGPGASTPPPGPDTLRRRHRLQAMARLQDELNTRVHPEWREQGHPYYRAVWAECAELLDHHGWKWWVDFGEPDFGQIHLELVDIWHFGLSELIRDHGVDDALADRFGDALAPEPDARPIPDLVEALAARTLANRTFALEPFARLMRATGLTETHLYRMYLAKNVLNAFRLAHGYRTGDYRKHWHDGREDNAHLTDLAAGLDPDVDNFSDRLHDRLATAYRETRNKLGTRPIPSGRDDL